MKNLLIMRHAKSSWKEAGISDHDRPLNARGKRAAPRMGQLLREQQLRPDVVFSSTAKRARKTAELVAKNCGSAPEVVLFQELYLAAPSDYLETLQTHADEHTRVMVVGHNPGLEQLFEILTGTYRPLPTAALASVELDLAKWSDLTPRTDCRLAGVWLPRELE